jgi:predicted enzyme related to lactoylglutathione lyase
MKVPEAKVAKNRVHLDLHPEGDAGAYLDGLVARGATVLDRHGDASSVRWATVADPEGNEFCVVLGRST